MKKLLWTFYFLLFAVPANAGTVVASINGTPITDTDVTARTRLMSFQGQSGTDNRRRALSNIIDDHIKLAYAESMRIVPADSDVKTEFEGIQRSGFDASKLTASDTAMLTTAVRANIAWQMVIGRTIMPTIDVTDEDIATERRELARERGLPIEMTFIRLVDIPTDVASRLTRPSSCDGAMDMARDLGGWPQRMTVLQYELSADVRTVLVDLAPMTWSRRIDGNVFLVCSTKRTKEWGQLDDIIKQNAMFRRASFQADQQLKQLRRRAVIVITDDRYK
ncbi:MAG: SurA N-terminal domain-containing protein [Alphaproteobacteria bacterium]|nr:SurA N-terminal domain-containing protein [Alphaproteobacteria bacterium]MCL2889734.1 SurA N-terminal domain-containing protein [Alphaproteobacteria bacterium]